ncbi:hypothetical protein YB2330_002368 [Saitoella coloradoensis]
MQLHFQLSPSLSSSLAFGTSSRFDSQALDISWELDDKHCPLTINPFDSSDSYTVITHQILGATLGIAKIHGIPIAAHVSITPSSYATRYLFHIFVRCFTIRDTRRLVEVLRNLRYTFKDAHRALHRTLKLGEGWDGCRVVTYVEGFGVEVSKGEEGKRWVLERLGVITGGDTRMGTTETAEPRTTATTTSTSAPIAAPKTTVKEVVRTKVVERDVQPVARTMLTANSTAANVIPDTETNTMTKGAHIEKPRPAQRVAGPQTYLTPKPHAGKQAVFQKVESTFSARLSAMANPKVTAAKAKVMGRETAPQAPTTLPSKTETQAKTSKVAVKEPIFTKREDGPQPRTSSISKGTTQKVDVITSPASASKARTKGTAKTANAAKAKAKVVKSAIAPPARGTSADSAQASSEKKRKEREGTVYSYDEEDVPLRVRSQREPLPKKKRVHSHSSTDDEEDLPLRVRCQQGHDTGKKGVLRPSPTVTFAAVSTSSIDTNRKASSEGNVKQTPMKPTAEVNAPKPAGERPRNMARRTAGPLPPFPGQSKAAKALGERVVCKDGAKPDMTGDRSHGVDALVAGGGIRDGSAFVPVSAPAIIMSNSSRVAPRSETSGQKADESDRALAQLDICPESVEFVATACDVTGTPLPARSDSIPTTMELMTSTRSCMFETAPTSPTDRRSVDCHSGGVVQNISLRSVVDTSDLTAIESNRQESAQLGVIQEDRELTAPLKAVDGSHVHIQQQTHTKRQLLTPCSPGTDTRIISGLLSHIVPHSTKAEAGIVIFVHRVKQLGDAIQRLSERWWQMKIADQARLVPILRTLREAHKSLAKICDSVPVPDIPRVEACARVRHPYQENANLPAWVMELCDIISDLCYHAFDMPESTMKELRVTIHALTLVRSTLAYAGVYHREDK